MTGLCFHPRGEACDGRGDPWHVRPAASDRRNRTMTQPRLTLNDGRSIPQLGFGLWQVPADQTAQVVQDGLAAGYRLIDGAAIYGNEAGLGEGLRQAALPRDQVFVTTKVWNDRQGRDETRRAVDESLARIGVDAVDLMLIHWALPGAGSIFGHVENPDRPKGRRARHLDRGVELRCCRAGADHRGNRCGARAEPDRIAPALAAGRRCAPFMPPMAS